VRLCDGGHSRICADCDPQDGDGFGGSSWPWSAKSHLDFLVGAFSWNAALRNRWFADSLLQESGFEPVWGFSCQVVFWFVGGSLYYHARSGCSSNRCRRASSICLIWPITNLSCAMSRSSSAATFGGNGEPSGVDRAARCSAALRRVGLKLRMPSRARLPFMRFTSRVRSRLYVRQDPCRGAKRRASPALSSSCKAIGRWSRSPPSLRSRKATMLKLPPLDTPSWRLPPEFRPLYAAVNRVRDLEATPGASLEEIAAARRAIAAAAVELTRLVDALRLFDAKQATVPYCGRA